MKQKTTLLIQYLTPSWLGNVLGLVTGIGIAASVIISTLYYGSDIQLQIFDIRSSSIVDQQQGAFANISLEAGNSSVLSTLPLLLTWAAVGLIVYFFAVTITKGFGRISSWREQIGYINSSPQHIVRSAFIMLAIRSVTVVLWLLFVRLTIDVIFPFALASAAAATLSLSAASIGYGLLAVIIVYVDVICHIFFLRLLLLRRRVLGL